MSVACSFVSIRRKIFGLRTSKTYIIKGRLTFQFEDKVNTELFNQGFGTANFSVPSLDIILEKYNVSSANAVFLGVRKNQKQTHEFMTSTDSGKFTSLIIEVDTTTISGQMTVISTVWGVYFPDTYI